MFDLAATIGTEAILPDGADHDQGPRFSRATVAPIEDPIHHAFITAIAARSQNQLAAI